MVDWFNDNVDSFLSTREGRQAFYRSKVWRNARETQLNKQPLCQFHLNKGEIVAASVVDHIIDIKDDVYKALSPNNLCSLCVSCHNRKTAEAQGWVKESLGKLVNNEWKIDVSKFKR